MMRGNDSNNKTWKENYPLNITILILISFILVFSSISLFSTRISAQENKVYSITIEGDIDGGTANYVERAVSKAEKEQSPLIIKIDTPGGLVNPTKDIVDKILNSDITVVSWVTPDGAWAYSAGAFITMAGDIAVMENGTSIGSAEPRPAENKTIQAMASWMREIAEKQGRPGDKAKKFVTENMNIGAEEALRMGLIDHVEGKESQILEILGSSGSSIEKIERGFTDQLMSVLTNPTIAFLLLLIGVLGLVTEITTGGVGVPGVGGTLALILALFGLSVLELTTAGTALIIVGIILLTAEYFDPGLGVFGIGGSIALFLGILLVGDEPYFEVSSWVLMVLAAVLIIFSLFVIWAVRRAQKKEAETGMEKMIGEEGKVTKRLDPTGVVKVKGERWTASSDEEIDVEESVVVKDIIEVNGQTTLSVERSREN